MLDLRVDGGHTGPLATNRCQPRQARKGAAVAANSGAGVWLVRPSPGEVSERLKEHAWKVCMGRKPIEGSNPSLSATCI